MKRVMYEVSYRLTGGGSKSRYFFNRANAVEAKEEEDRHLYGYGEESRLTEIYPEDVDPVMVQIDTLKRVYRKLRIRLKSIEEARRAGSSSDS